MEISENVIQSYYKDIYSYALYKLGDKHQAEDIASQTINLYLLKSDMISPEKTESWMRGTCLNYCRKYYENVIRDRSVVNNAKEDLITYYHHDHSEDSNMIFNFRKAMEKLNELETRSLILYFNSGQNIKKMAEIIGENHASLRKRISRIKQKLKAETYKELGFIATKKIIVPQMHEAIIQFIKRLKKHVESNTIEKMFYYFSEVDITEYEPDFDIKTIKEYEVILRDGKYTIFLFYLNSYNEMNNIHFTFYVNRKNQLKITRLPKLQPKIISFKKNTVAAKEILKHMKSKSENHRGMIRLTPEILKEIELKSKN